MVETRHESGHGPTGSLEHPSYDIRVAVDMVIFTVMDEQLQVLLLKRNRWPFVGYWSLPGGLVQVAESLEAAGKRILTERTGLGLEGEEVYLEQLYTWGDPNRDPRSRAISVSYFALVDSTKVTPFSNERGTKEEVSWYPMSSLAELVLGFDHTDIITYALKRLRYKLEYTAVGLELLPEMFTLTELQRIYEIILDEELDKRNFRIVQPETHNAIIVDYGQASVRPDYSTRASGCTIQFAAPEIIEGKPPIPESDLYSLGLTILYALGGDPIEKTIPDDVPEELKEYLMALLRTDPLTRPNWNTIDMVRALSDLRLELFGRRATL